MRRFLAGFVLCGALIGPAVMKAGDDKREHDNRYYDPYRRDYHEWNDSEDRAYRHYLEERREQYRDWNKLSRKDQREYWRWRHAHPGDEWRGNADRDDRDRDHDRR